MPPPDKPEADDGFQQHPCGCRPEHGCFKKLDGPLPPTFYCENEAEPPVDPEQSIEDAERADRERREEEIRRANADMETDPPSPFPDQDSFYTTGMVRIWLGFDSEGKQQIRFDWDATIPTTSVIGACEFLSAVAKARMAGTLE